MDSFVNIEVTYAGRNCRLSLPRSTSTFADILPQFLLANQLLAGVDLEVRKYLFKGRSYSGTERSILLSSLETSPGDILSIMMQATTGGERKLIAEAKPARLRDDLGPQIRSSSSSSMSSSAKHIGPLYGGSRETGDVHGFGSVSVLPGFADSDKAQSILESVARDPGVLAVMKERKWFVPVLGELYPDGKVGIDPVCVLGLNENMGQRILLRIRTDDLLGFRKIGIVMQTVWHELAHNMLGEHTGEFYALVSALKRRGDELDWTKTRGHVLGSESNLFRRENLFIGGASKATSEPLTFGTSFTESMDEALRSNMTNNASDGSMMQDQHLLQERSSGKKRINFHDDDVIGSTVDSANAMNTTDESSTTSSIPFLKSDYGDSFLYGRQKIINDGDMSILDGDLKSSAEVEANRKASLEEALLGMERACLEADISYVDALETLRGIFERAKNDRSGQFRQMRKKNAAFVNRTTGTAPAIDAIICAGWKHDGEWVRFNDDKAALWMALNMVEMKIEKVKRP
jgi:hypothetical protein